MTKAQAKTKTEAFEVPADIRELAEKSVDQAQVVYGQFRDATQETVDLLDVTATAVKDSAATLQLKALDIAQANMLAGFDFARKIATAKDFKEVADMQATFARTQISALTEQTTELGGLAAKTAEAAAKPIKDGMTKSFDQAKTAFKV